MLELLAPAGSPEAVVAAVQNGTNAIYLGLETLNARRNAKNFTEDNFARVAEYCHVRGVKVYVTLNVLVSDRELNLAERVAKTASRRGADALIIQDLGVLEMVRQTVPEMRLHASTQMSIHNLDGVRRAADLGISRVVLARELGRAHVAYIAKHAPIEVEVFVHGALCMSYSGQCYMSAAIGGRSGNRGLCAQPCRLPYSLDGSPPEHHLSLKDNSLAGYLKELETCGVKSLKIEGRMKRPEYTAIATRIFSQAIQEGREPSEKEMKLLTTVFSRDGFTDGYWTQNLGPHMLGMRREEEKRELKIFTEVRNAYTKVEVQRIPVRFFAIAKKGEPFRLAVSDDAGNVAKAEGSVPQPAQHQALTKDQLLFQISKTGGTPYLSQDFQSVLDEGLYLPAAEMNRLRRTVLDELTAIRGAPPVRSEGLFRPGEPAPKREEPPQLNVSLRRAAQLTEEMANLRPSLFYLPLDEILEKTKLLRPYFQRDNLTFSAILPRVILDSERDALKKQLDQLLELGVKECLVGNMGHIDLALRAGFLVRGDFGLNIFNGQALKTFGEMGLSSATASFELKLAQIRDMSKEIDLELIAYGRLPLMLTENCIIKNGRGNCNCEIPNSLTDRRGAVFPLVKDSSHRSVILNSRKLFLADKAQDYMDIGLWGARLSFTTENAMECQQILARYLELGGFEPGDYTRGLYYRGVE